MKKRGAETLTLVYALELIAGVIIALLIIHVATSFGKGEAINKKYLAKDLALQLNTLYAIPGNAYIVNSENMGKFSIRFTNEFVEVYEFEKDPTRGIYPYVKTENSNLDVNFDKPKQLVLVKDGNKIIVQETIPEFKKVSCPEINTKDLNWRTNKKIIIDPGHGYDEKSAKLEESKITTDITDSLKAQFLGSKYKLTRDGNYDLSVNDRLGRIENENPDMVISLHVGNYPDKDNIVYAYVPKTSDKERENWKLACLILNQLTEEFDIDETKIIREDISKLNPNDPKQVLKFDNKVSVMLEIGNIKSEKSKEMLKDIVQISGSIYQGIKDYYEK